MDEQYTDLSKLSRYDLARMAVSGREAQRKMARKAMKDRLKTSKSVKAGKTAAKRIAIAAAASTIPAYILTKNPDLAYLDEDQTIETEAALSVVTLVAGLGYYLWKPEGAGAEELFDAGLFMSASYLSHRAREMAKEDLLEDAETVDQAA